MGRFAALQSIARYSSFFPSTLLSRCFLQFSLQLQKQSLMGPCRAANLSYQQGAALFSSWRPIEANTWEYSFPCLSFPFGPNLFLSLLATHAELKRLWHHNVNNIAKCSCIFYTAAVDKAYKIPLLWTAVEYCVLYAGCFLATEKAAFWPTGVPHRVQIPKAILSLNPLPSSFTLHSAFIPIPILFLWLYLCDCMPGSWLNHIIARNFISEGCFYSW